MIGFHTPLRALTVLVLMTAGALADAQPAGGRGAGGRGRDPQGPGFGLPPRDAAPAPAIARGSSIISGLIVVAGTGQPARRARVTLNGVEGGRGRTATTDDFGAFAFTSLPAGRYTLHATKPGHVGVTYGQTSPGRPGTPIDLTEGGKFAATLQIPRGSVITGTVVDEYGEPTPGIQVRALRYVTQSGRRTLQQSGNGASTDDRGVYRVFGLQPGEYVVSAVPRNAGPPEFGRLQAQLPVEIETLPDDVRAPAIRARIAMLQDEAALQAQTGEQAATGYAPVYYPGTVSSAQAAPIGLGVGEERPNVDFQLQRVPMARVEGTVIMPAGVAAQNVQLVLTETSQAAPAIGAQMARADSEGRFRLTNVAPGNYRLVAGATTPVASADGRPAPPSGRGGRGNARAANAIRLWGAVDVPVDGRDVTSLVLTLQPGLSVSGRIEFNATTQPMPADLSRVRVTLIPMDQPLPGTLRPESVMADATGRFTIPSVVPATYRLTASGAGAEWLLESSTIDGQDTLDFPVEIGPGGAVTGAAITFTDRRAALTGAITSARGEAAPHFTLILYPADDRYWVPQSRRIRSTRPATTGQFSFADLPPGEYKLAALADVEPGAWTDPAFLQQIDAGSMRVTVREGEHKVQNIQVAAGERP